VSSFFLGVLKTLAGAVLNWKSEIGNWKSPQQLLELLLRLLIRRQNEYFTSVVGGDIDWKKGLAFFSGHDGAGGFGD
jgi:hypothetical protein